MPVPDDEKCLYLEARIDKEDPSRIFMDVDQLIAAFGHLETENLKQISGYAIYTLTKIKAKALDNLREIQKKEEEK